MPRSPDAERRLAEAREALERGSLERAADHAWAGAGAAASIGDEQTLQALCDLAAEIERATTGHEHDEAQRLQVYLSRCLEDAKRGTRRPSAFERLLGRDRRSR